MMTDSCPEGDPQIIAAPSTDPAEAIDPDFPIEGSGGPLDIGDPVQTSPPPK
jgi:hypothetical protein